MPLPSPDVPVRWGKMPSRTTEVTVGKNRCASLPAAFSNAVVSSGSRPSETGIDTAGRTMYENTKGMINAASSARPDTKPSLDSSAAVAIDMTSSRWIAADDNVSTAAYDGLDGGTPLTLVREAVCASAMKPHLASMRAHADTNAAIASDPMMVRHRCKWSCSASCSFTRRLDAVLVSTRASFAAMAFGTTLLMAAFNDSVTCTRDVTSPWRTTLARA